MVGTGLSKRGVVDVIVLVVGCSVIASVALRVVVAAVVDEVILSLLPGIVSLSCWCEPLLVCWGSWSSPPDLSVMNRPLIRLLMEEVTAAVIGRQTARRHLAAGADSLAPSR